MVLECLLLVSFPTVESTSVSSTLSLVLTLTRRTPTTSPVPVPNSPVRKLLPSWLDTHHTHSILSVVGFRCSPRSPSPSGCTRALLIASERLSRMRELLLFSRVLVPMLSVLLELPWCLCFTLRSLLSSEAKNKNNRDMCNGIVVNVI